MKFTHSTIVFLLVCLFGMTGFSIQKNTSDTFLSKELTQFEEYIPQRDILNKDVSKADVAWHLDHTLKVINEIYKTLETSNPEEYVKNTKFVKHIVFTTGKIPRGRAKATKAVTPPDKILTEDIYAQLTLAKKNLQMIENLPEGSFMKHPVFGNLKRDDSRKFIKIHTRHHLSIIKDILKK